MIELLHRREMMREQGGGCPYIEDGLTSWIDGLNYVDGGSIIDPYSGVVFSSANGNARNVDGGIYINGDDYFIANAMIPTDDIKTIEACFKLESGTEQIILTTGNIVLGFPSYGGGFWWYLGQRRTLVGVTNIDARTFSATIDEENVVVNLLQRAITGGGFPTSVNYYAIAGAEIGTRLNGGYYLLNGTIYSIRLYNRKLTVAEMLFNQQVDNERFNLGL